MTQKNHTYCPTSLFRATPPAYRRGASLSVFRIVIMAAAIAVGSLVQPVQAQTSNWTNTGNSSSFYDLSSNWNPAGAPGASGRANFHNSETYQVWWDVNTPNFTPSVGSVNVQNGNVTFLNTDNVAQHQFSINGSGGAGSLIDLFIADGSLTIRGIHVRNLGGAQVLSLDVLSSLTLDGSHPSGARLSVEGSAGFSAIGDVNIFAGGIMNSTKTDLAAGYTSNVTGTGSQWNTTNALELGRFFSGLGPQTMNVSSGGLLTSGSGSVGSAIVNVSDTGSHWNNRAVCSSEIPGSVRSTFKAEDKSPAGAAPSQSAPRLTAP